MNIGNKCIILVLDQVMCNNLDVNIQDLGFDFGRAV
jgi:hypothetical protein